MTPDTEHRDTPKRPRKRGTEHERQDEIGYRNVDEEAEHDESGPQGPGLEENPPREQ